MRKERGEAWAAGGRKRAGEGLREERMEQGSKEMKLQGRYPEYTVYSHPIPQRALAIATCGGGIARGKDGAREQGNETSREVS